MATKKAASVGKSSLERRKLPSQQRAKVTVEKILRAANDLMQEDGFSNISTGKIAERAGVNIASLYKYFPNRDTILLGLYEEAASQGAYKLNTLAMTIVHDDLDTAVPKIMKLLLAHYEQNSAILLRMVSEVPEIRRATRVVPFEIMIRSTIRLYLQHHPEFRAKDTSRHMFFLQNIVVGNLRTYVMDPPADVARKDFLAHLSRVVIAYLKGELA